MSRVSWETLIKRYCPRGMRVCNCGQAYETHFPASSKMCLGATGWVDHWACASGCSAAQIEAREIVAAAILEGESSC